ncbi:unnamed protein product [Chilo suppressalis]|uniref:Zinc finger DNA binding protein n=1 Tax=Chilo suppressalis TaxID=168631 RepID=A0ABN8B6A2_CHISP|nr:unnamed protein product [Chilo suppressalis]
MPNLMRSPTLNKSHSMVDTVVDKVAGTIPLLEELTHRTQRESKRRRVSDDQPDLMGSDLRKIIREELRIILSELQAQQNSRMDNLEQHITDIKNQNDNMKVSTTDIGTSIEFVTNKLGDIQTAISRLDAERKQIGIQISQIEEKCDSLQRLSRKTCIQIRNVPKQKGETKELLFNNIHKLSSTLGLTLNMSDLRDAYRVPSKHDHTTSIIVGEFSSTLIKSNILLAAKKFNSNAIKYKTQQLNSHHLGLEGPKVEIYLAEHLTPFTASRLFFLARDFGKTMGYDFCWTSNGLVYLQRKQDDPYILVKSEAQLQILRNK